MSRSVDVETAEGPWEWFKNKGNSTTLQIYIVPWLIALRGFGFAKKIKDTTQIREMIALVKCLADYYEKIRHMEGAGGLRAVKSFKRRFKEIKRHST